MYKSITYHWRNLSLQFLFANRKLPEYVLHIFKTTPRYFLVCVLESILFERLEIPFSAILYIHLKRCII